MLWPLVGIRIICERCEQYDDFVWPLRDVVTANSTTAFQTFTDRARH